MGYKEEFVLYTEGEEGNSPEDSEAGAGEEKDSSPKEEKAPAKSSKIGSEEEAGEENYTVFIPPGSSLQDAADILVQEGVVQDAGKFENEIYRLQLSRNIRAGEYTIPPSAEMGDIIDIITRR